MIFWQKLELTMQSQTFCRMMLNVEGTVLKLDFVNDVAFHAGGFWRNNYYSRLDNPINILSNKIGAVQRNAAKDMADILYLSFNQDFNWMQIIEDAQRKDAWVNEVEIASYIESFDKSAFQSVRWTGKQDFSFLKESLHTIAKEILMGADNSLKS